MTDIFIRRVEPDEVGFKTVFAMLIDLHREGGYAPLDPSVASLNCHRVIEEGMTFIAEADGRAVGTIALTELAFWYATETFLQDAWFFVAPEQRRGLVGVRLLRTAREEAQRRNKIAFITVNNPDRRPKYTPASLESQVAGFVPLGYTLKIR